MFVLILINLPMADGYISRCFRLFGWSFKKVAVTVTASYRSVVGREEERQEFGFSIYMSPIIYLFEKNIYGGSNSVGILYTIICHIQYYADSIPVSLSWT